MNVTALLLITAAAAPMAALASPRQGQAAATIRVQSSYQIGAQDELKITVFDAPELSGSYRVDSDGFITFPLLGRIRVGATTLGETQEQLRAMLANGYIRNPQLRVDVAEYKSQSVYVSGEVRSPAEIRMTGSMTLLKALAQAGSPLSSASSELTIARQRRQADGSTAASGENSDVIRVNWRDLQTGRASDVALQDGDVIFVPKAQTFYIQGYVRNGGTFVLEPGLTVEQAIALAGGVTDRGTNRGIKASRALNGKTTEVDLKLSDKVQPGDVITIKQRLF
jgi:polysaccharide export outer membrane protein